VRGKHETKMAFIKSILENPVYQLNSLSYQRLESVLYKLSVDDLSCLLEIIQQRDFGIKNGDWHPSYEMGQLEKKRS